MYMQYGCGWCAPVSWVNFDASPTLRFERIPIVGRIYTKNVARFPKNAAYGDIVRGLPIARASCTAIYCSHVLEHLALEDFHRALNNTFSYLAPGGTFRLVVPDMEQLARDYLSSGDCMRFIEQSFLGRKRRPRGLRMIFALLGNSDHLWMWDERSMRKALQEHGFIDIRRAVFGDAADLRFREVEEKSRFDGCLAMECRRPANY